MSRAASKAKISTTVSVSSTTSSESEKISSILNELKQSFNSNKTKPYSWRINQLVKLKQFLVDNEELFKEGLKSDLGRHAFEAVGLDILPTLGELDYMIKHLKSWMEPTYTPVPLWMAPASSEIIYEPYGVCLILGPFNYPITLVLSPLMGAIAAGNCAVVKPSEMNSNIEKIFYEQLLRYMDNDCIRVVIGGVSTTTELLKLRWDKIFFTGSPRVGKIVMKAAAEYLTPVSLELGGKSPTIIDESVDSKNMDLITQRILWGKCINAGQTCVAPDYIFCHEKHYHTFLQTMKKKIISFYGNTDEIRQNNPDFARIVSKEHCKRLKAMIDECDVQSVFFGGKVDVDQKFVEPTILTDISLDSKVMTEEIFGPLLPVIKYKDLQEVITYVKKGEKPLTMYIFATNRKNIDQLTSNISSGSVLVNDTIFQFANIYLPFGGVGESGMGGYHGKFSYTCFSHQRSVLRRDDHLFLDVPVRYPPYSDFALKFFRFAVLLPFTQPVITKKSIYDTIIWSTSVAITSYAIYKYMN